jgi:hypothetical protein
MDTDRRDRQTDYRTGRHDRQKDSVRDSAPNLVVQTRLSRFVSNSTATARKSLGVGYTRKRREMGTRSHLSQLMGLFLVTVGVTVELRLVD